MAASCAVPGIYRPVRIGGRWLVDDVELFGADDVGDLGPGPDVGQLLREADVADYTRESCDEPCRFDSPHSIDCSVSVVGSHWDNIVCRLTARLS